MITSTFYHQSKAELLNDESIDSYIEDALATARFLLKTFYILSVVFTYIILVSWEGIKRVSKLVIIVYNFLAVVINELILTNKGYTEQLEENYFLFYFKTLRMQYELLLQRCKKYLELFNWSKFSGKFKI
jgi:hypothetical protein